MTPDSEILTIMFIDIAGYTKKTTQLSRTQFKLMHDYFDSISIPTFQKYFGRVIKKIGDAYLVTFKSATDAVICGIELIHSFKEFNKLKKIPQPLHIKVALHAGEVIIRNQDIYGDAVNTAARIEGAAKAGQIVFSESVFSMMNKNEVNHIFLGAHKFKGVKYPVKLFRVKTKYDQYLQKKRREKILRKKKKRKITEFFKRLFAILIIFGLISLLMWFLYNYV
ncbi:adenylate/guanylate cyclase domain-containing protein [Candidatus Woesearchaeota archaeon]|jgi:adenylate cyclase|nr:adenylate/guanylate cyclase domain-containing protein [Candidatus Woesearchaeota archaeon]